MKALIFTAVFVVFSISGFTVFGTGDFSKAGAVGPNVHPQSNCLFLEGINKEIEQFEQHLDQNDVLIRQLQKQAMFEDWAGVMNDGLISLLKEKERLLRNKISRLYSQRWEHLIIHHLPPPNYA